MSAARPRVLFITHRGQRHQHMALEAVPPELDMIMRRDPAREEILALLPMVAALISERSGVIDAELLAAGQHLRLIQRLGAQTWDIDLEAARAASIPVCYWPVRTCVLVAEHMLMQIAQAAGDWGQPPAPLRRGLLRLQLVQPAGHWHPVAANRGHLGVRRNRHRAGPAAAGLPVHGALQQTPALAADR